MKQIEGEEEYKRGRRTTEKKKTEGEKQRKKVQIEGKKMQE